MKKTVVVFALMLGFMAMVQAQEKPDYVAQGILTADEAKDGFVPLFNGKNLDGWWIRGTNKEAYQAIDGKILVTGKEGGDWMFTNEEYDNFVLRYEYRCVSGEGNSGVGIRAPKVGNPAFDGFEIQVLRPGWPTPYQRACSLYAVQPVKVEADKPFGEWNTVEVMADGPRIKTILNGQEVYDVKVTDFTKDTVKEEWQKPADNRPAKGYIGLQSHSDSVEFRNLRIKTLPAKK
ncbi:MAG: DUF1080 domain-containing protein [Candidatus Hydrogenedentes bacterium]|nr:DUF1080 domain-containing protein [Candidatus Hydrogenedentota bacterium]